MPDGCMNLALRTWSSSFQTSILDRRAMQDAMRQNERLAGLGPTDDTELEAFGLGVDPARQQEDFGRQIVEAERLEARRPRLDGSIWSSDAVLEMPKVVFSKT